MIQTMQRLYPRGATNRGVCVDVGGAMLGPDWPLVDRTTAGYRVAPRMAVEDVQKVLLIDRREPDWLYKQGWRIADALSRDEIALAQIYGLRIPIGDIDHRQLKRLTALAELRKAGFNPDEPRIPAGQHGGGEWTTGRDNGGEGADRDNSGGDGTTGGGNEAIANPMSALRYMGEPDTSPATPLVGGRFPAPAGANANPLFFPTQAEEDENGRGSLLSDFMDLPVEFRREVYEALRARLEAIDPGNLALDTLTGPDYSPTQADIDALNEALREAQEQGSQPPATEWELGWGARGVALEQQRLGGQRTLPFNAPTIDDFSDDGVAVNIKSIDLKCSVVWQSAKPFLSNQSLYQSAMGVRRHERR